MPRTVTLPGGGSAYFAVEVAGAATLRVGDADGRVPATTRVVLVRVR